MHGGATMSCLCKKKRVSRKKLEEVIDQLYKNKDYYRAQLKKNLRGVSEDFFKDMFQEFAIKMLRDYCMFDRRRDFRKWSGVMFFRICLDGFRRSRTRRKHYAVGLPWDEEKIAPEMFQKQTVSIDMIDALDELSAVGPHAWLVYDSYLMGSSTKELAEEMGAPENTVKTRKRAVMVKLEERAKK